MPAETSFGYLSLGGTEDITAVDAAADNSIVSAAPFVHVTKRFTFAQGAGAYTYRIALDVSSSTIVKNSAITFILEFSAGTNPTVEFYNDTVGGTLLQTVTGLADASTFLFEPYFTGTEWKKCDGRYSI